MCFLIFVTVPDVARVGADESQRFRSGRFRCRGGRGDIADRSMRVRACRQRAPGARSPRRPDGLAKPSRIPACLAAAGAPIAPRRPRFRISPEGARTAPTGPRLPVGARAVLALAPHPAEGSWYRTHEFGRRGRARASSGSRPSQRERPAVAGRSELGERASLRGCAVQFWNGVFSAKYSWLSALSSAALGLLLARLFAALWP